MADGADEVKNLKPSEFVSRCAIHPRYLNNGAFAYEAFLDLGKVTNEKKPPYVISCLSRILRPRPEQIHDWGRRKAAAATLRKPENPCTYQGFYDLSVEDVTSISCSGYDISVVLAPEEGEDAHCNIVLHPDTSCAPSQLRAARTDFLAKLGAHLRGPTPYSATDPELTRVPSLPALPTCCDKPIFFAVV